MNHENLTSLAIQKASEKPNYKLRRKAAALLAGAAVLGGSYAIDRGEDFLKNNAHTNTEIKDFGKYKLASDPIELAKLYKREGIGSQDLTFLTIHGELNPTEVAVEMGAKRVYDVANYIIQPQVDNPKVNAHTMHSGQIVVVPNDMLEVQPK